jgi:hypothetical protein
MEREFKVGDRVKTELGIGMIKFIDCDIMPYTVEHNYEIKNGHNCDGKCKDNHGRWYHEYELSLIEELKKNTTTTFSNNPI